MSILLFCPAVIIDNVKNVKHIKKGLVLDMKILKKAVQKNVVLKKSEYLLDDINTLLNERKIWYFDESFEICYDEVNYIKKYNDTEFRIFTDKLTEIKVVLNENGFYKTVGIGKDGYKYFVEL